MRRRGFIASAYGFLVAPFVRPKTITIKIKGTLDGESRAALIRMLREENP